MPFGAESMFEGDVFDFNSSKPATAEVTMWMAVVAQVWIDAFTEGEAIRGARPHEWIDVRAEARRWLLLDFGGWKSDRDDVCGNANLDGDAVRRAAIRRLELAHVEDEQRRTVALVEIDRAFMALVAREATMRRGEITRAMRFLAEREANL